MNEIQHKKGKIYYSMGEVTEMFDVNASLIRFWEQKFDILKPHKNKKGNRLFTPEDVDNLKLIYHLVKEKGMTLSGAQKRIKENRSGIGRDMEIVDRLLNVKAMLQEIREELKDNGEGIGVSSDYDDETEETERPVAGKLDAVECADESDRGEHPVEEPAEPEMPPRPDTPVHDPVEPEMPAIPEPPIEEPREKEVPVREPGRPEHEDKQPPYYTDSQAQTIGMMDQATDRPGIHQAEVENAETVYLFGEKLDNVDCPPEEEPADAKSETETEAAPEPYSDVNEPADHNVPEDEDYDNTETPAAPEHAPELEAPAKEPSREAMDLGAPSMFDDELDQLLPDESEEYEDEGLSEDEYSEPEDLDHILAEQTDEPDARADLAEETPRAEAVVEAPKPRIIEQTLF